MFIAQRLLLRWGPAITLFLSLQVPVASSQAQESVETGDGPTVTRTQHRDWLSICVEQNGGAKRCVIQQTLRAEQPDGTQLQFQISVSRQEEQDLAEIVLPLGLDLRPGIVVQVDENDEINVPVVTCLAQGCLALLTLDESRLEQFKLGSRLRMGFLTLATSEMLVVEFSLFGFTRAFDRVAAVSLSDFAIRQPTR